MGIAGSRVEKSLGAGVPEDERFFGFENFGNTCYCNSVLQALFFCRPFRQCLLAHHAAVTAGSAHEDDLLACLAELFAQIAGQKKRCGVLAPRKFVARLRKENELFRGYMHQDAHEFLNFLLNSIAERLAADKKADPRPNKYDGCNGIPSASRGAAEGNGHAGGAPESTSPHALACDSLKCACRPSTDGHKAATWVHAIFEGVLTSETRCLSCECVSSKDESFLDLSVDIEQHTSITGCLRNFSSTETLCREHKYYCENCCSLQEAQKRMRIKRLPRVLALHLKRFKYMEDLRRLRKLHHRVVFPLELRLFNTSDDAVDADRMYDLFAVVVHVGGGMNHGHYICVVKSHGHWIVFDDDNLELMQGADLKQFFGAATDSGGQQSSESGYILFYESRMETGVSA